MAKHYKGRAWTHPALRGPRPYRVAHRFGASGAPENTMEAAARAYQLGYRFFETDAELTVDGRLVAVHDLRLDRISDRTGAIAELTLSEVQEADLGYSWTQDGQTFPFRGQGVRVPLLEEVLTTFPDVRFSIDPKSDRAVGPLIDLLVRLDALDRVVVGSFKGRRLQRVRERPRACTSMSPGEVAKAWGDAMFTGRMRRFGAELLQVPVRRHGVTIVTPRFIRAAHRAGLQVQVWTINDPQEMNRLLDWDVDGIQTDDLEALSAVFSQRGLSIA